MIVIQLQQNQNQTEFTLFIVLLGLALTIKSKFLSLADDDLSFGAYLDPKYWITGLNFFNLTSGHGLINVLSQ